MAASTGQGRSFTGFLVGFTILCYGIGYFSTGLGKISLVVGGIILLGSMAGFMKLKPLEGRIAQGPSSTGMKLAGAFASCLGWIITLFGIHLVPSVTGQDCVRSRGDCCESVRAHLHPASRLQQERDLENLEA